MWFLDLCRLFRRRSLGGAMLTEREVGLETCWMALRAVPGDDLNCL